MRQKCGKYLFVGSVIDLVYAIEQLTVAEEGHQAN